MPPAAFSEQRALERLRWLAQQADAARSAPAEAASTLDRALRETGADPIGGPWPEAPLGARVRGRESGAPWLVCAPCYLPAAPDAPPWRANAHGSGAALLLELLACLADAAPAEDVLALLFPASADFADSAPAVEAWASRDLLPLRGVLAVWQVASPGAPLELDLRSLGYPAARSLAHELFLLGRTLGHAAFGGGAQTAFPGLHVPFLERGIPTVPLCANSDLLAGTGDDRLEHVSAASLRAVGDTLLRFLRGERVV